MKKPSFRSACLVFVLCVGFSGCVSPVEETPIEVLAEVVPVPATPDQPVPTLLPTREPFPAGTLVDYTAQTGDNLPALAAHFNTHVDDILAANPIIPKDATTMPAGLPMKIPINYLPFWGSPFQILPDSLFINGPAQVGFDPVEFVNSKPGWFKNYSFYLGKQNRRGGEIIEYIATNYSISPRVLLALMEYQTGGLVNEEMPENIEMYPLGYHDQFHQGLTRQLIWAANVLNNGYYGWRTGRLGVFNLRDGREQRPDPWQNAASVALQFYYAKALPLDAYTYAISGEGFLATYAQLFGDPWVNVQDHIPGSLVQPELRLPFVQGKIWAFTGGPHTGWGEGDPFSALDFAPPNVVGGCRESEEFATAVADGIIARTGDAVAVLDLDGDGDERTGWVIFYLHLANASLPKVGAVLNAGDSIGLPSCEGGEATGTHMHIARKYNGEWIAADGALAFNLEGWIAKNGSEEYLGSLTRFGKTVRACVCSDKESQIQAAAR